jgi:enoyl-CoA hydratase/carnithine racemase
MDFDFIRYEKSGRIAWITFNRPEVMNALHRPAHEELAQAFEDFRRDDETWIAILTGAGDRAFSAGNDLKITADLTARGERTWDDSDPVFGAITSGYDCPKPIIAAVNGVAIGGGLEIALACDIVVAADSARFGLREPRVGLIAGSGGIHRLARQIPFKHAMGMLLTGRVISAHDAFSYGLVNEVVPLPELRAAALRWAEEILACSPLSVRLTKEAVFDGMFRSVDDAVARDRQRLDRLFASEDFVEGPLAFSEKREPKWSGR